MNTIVDLKKSIEDKIHVDSYGCESCKKIYSHRKILLADGKFICPKCLIAKSEES